MRESTRKSTASKRSKSIAPTSKSTAPKRSKPTTPKTSKSTAPKRSKSIVPTTKSIAATNKIISLEPKHQAIEKETLDIEPELKSTMLDLQNRIKSMDQNVRKWNSMCEGLLSMLKETIHVAESATRLENELEFKDQMMQEFIRDWNRIYTEYAPSSPDGA